MSSGHTASSRPVSHEPPEHASIGSRSSIQRRLPLMMSGVLVLVMLASLAITWTALRESATSITSDRLTRAARQLAAIADQSLGRLGSRLLDVARDDAVRRVLRPDVPDAASIDQAREALENLLAPADTGLAVELWSTDGRRIVTAGSSTSVDGRLPDGTRLVPDMPVPHPGLAAIEASDSLGVGALFRSANGVRFWMVAPVMDGNRRIGYLAQERRVAGNPQTSAMLRELTADDVSLFYRNVDGDFWVSADGQPQLPSIRSDSADDVALAHREGVGRVITADARIRGMPVALVLEAPLRSSLLTARTTIATLALLGALLVIAGAIAAWLVTRRITRPLSSLAVATEAIAAGDYDSRVEVAGGDELARLAMSFNRMAAEISGSQGELEERVRSAHSIAGELEEANDRLEESNRHLQEAIVEAAAARQEAEEARAQAEAASRAKSEFLAVMSHELRTPLNAIAGYTELMTLGLRGPVTDEQRRDLERIRASQEHLLGLISAVLDLSRIEAGRVSYELVAVDLQAFLGGLDALVAPQAAAKSLTLVHVPATPRLSALADAEKLRQVLLNLLSNAIRYTPPGGRVTLSASAVNPHTVAIAVEDTGVGIPAEAMEGIFEPFVQLDRSLTRIRDGVGLGLAISRDLVRAMSGELTVESRVGEGSRFTVVLPQAPAGAARLAPITGEHQLGGLLGARSRRVARDR